MSQIRTPPSLKWLLNKRARLLGSIEKLEKDLPGQLLNSRRQVKEAEVALRRAIQLLSIQEKGTAQHLEALKNDLKAIDTALGLHHIRIDPSIIPSIHSHDTSRVVSHGDMTRSIFKCLKLAEEKPMTTTQIAVYVASCCRPDLSDEEFPEFRLRIGHRLRNLLRDKKLLRTNQNIYHEGSWILAKEATQITQVWRTKVSPQDA